MIYDVIIIGMGPAGSTAAYEAASRGLSVLALDQSAFPRYKACGGGLTTKIHQLVDLENLSCIENRISSFRLSYRSHQKTFHQDKPFAYLVMRDQFDQMLVERAVKAGVDFKGETRVQKIDEQNDLMEVHTDCLTFKARVAVGADGALGFTTRWLNPCLKSKNAPALEGEFKRNHDPVDSSSIEIEVGAVESGYGWIFPKRECLSIGAASFSGNQKIKKSYQSYMTEVFSKTNPSLLLPDPPPKPAVCLKETGHPIPIFTSPGLKLVSKRLMLAGDAGHLVDPFFGEGIYYAMRSGQIAGRASETFIKKGASLKGYAKKIEKEFYPEFRGAKRMAWLIYRFPGLWFDLTLKHPGVIQLYTEVLAGKREYRNFLSTVLKTAFKKILLPNSFIKRLV
ncbi:MAG: geranylgeranyl reductase family protein [Nitrospirae bacterium]|nr:geranylgeranyl reductase family protein [Nitrospirota bacterium]MBI3353157.1 geranylgeranyl reductase family protein [Nitrospirota bacterium]